MASTFEINGIKITWLGHASFKIKTPKGKVVYIDPYAGDYSEKADIILVTHDHFDHCDVGKIETCRKDDTIIVGATNVKSKVPDAEILDWWEEKEVDGIKIVAVPAYNPNKRFHPKDYKGVGWLIKINNTTIYHAGDTDLIDEMRELRGKVTVALLPIGGIYTMDEKEAASAVEYIEPEYVIPMHYNYLEGLEKDPEEFKKLVGDKAEVVILEPAL